MTLLFVLIGVHINVHLPGVTCGVSIRVGEAIGE